MFLPPPPGPSEKFYPGKKSADPHAQEGGAGTGGGRIEKVSQELLNCFKP